ncbi:MAG: hypothetical protein IJS50_05340, partial [Desulfovibrio sp.]|nr:hypothetical protein [Desulfovibrio sp.]
HASKESSNKTFLPTILPKSLLMSAQLRFFLLLLLTSFVFLLNACAYSIMDDKRLLDTMSSDKAMATSIKTALVENNFTKSFSVAVSCY